MQMTNERVEQFKAEAAQLNLKVGNASRDTQLQIAGLVLMVVGIGVAILLAMSSESLSDPRSIQTNIVWGLSDRDIEAALGEALGGAQAALSRSTVSRICQQIRDEFAAWCERRLDDVVLDYLFLDGSHFRMHPGAPAEPVLAAWGIDTDGKPVFVGLAPAAAESTDGWADFLEHLKARGLRAPLLGISDGAAGLVGAFELAFPASLRQRCLIHRCGNIIAKVPVAAQAEVKGAYWEIFDLDDSFGPGEKAIAEVTRRAEAFSARYQKLYPAAVRCLQAEFDSLTTFLRFPREHWSRTRHSNFIERTFGETRRRVKVIGRLPGESSCVSLVWAVLDRASRGWRGVTQTPDGLRLLQDLRRALLEPPVQLDTRRPGRGKAHDADGEALSA